MMAINSSDFLRYSICIGSVVIRPHGTLQCYIVGAPFCAARHINDPIYLQGDPDINVERAKARVANVYFARMESRPRNYPVQHNVVCVKSVRNIKTGEELYSEYGTAYWDNIAQFEADGEGENGTEGGTSSTTQQPTPKSGKQTATRSGTRS